MVSEEREPVNKVCTIETPSGEYRQTTAKERLRWAANAVKMAKRSISVVVKYAFMRCVACLQYQAPIHKSTLSANDIAQV